MSNYWFIHPYIYPFCTTITLKDMPKTTLPMREKEFIPYAPSDCRKILAYKINAQQIIYISYNQNKSITARYYHKIEDRTPWGIQPKNIKYTTDPLQYEDLYQHPFKYMDKPSFTKLLVDNPDIIAYTTKPNRYNIYTFYRLLPNNQPITVKDLINDEDWHRHTFS